jgi:hypothetical protein
MRVIISHSSIVMEYTSAELYGIVKEGLNMGWRREKVRGKKV